MTQPHPQPDKYLLITAEELLIVEHGCIYPDKNECVGKLCKYHDPNPSFRDNIVCLLNEHDVADNVRYRPHTPAAPVTEPICDDSCKRKHCSRKFCCCEYDGDFDE